MTPILQTHKLIIACIFIALSTVLSAQDNDIFSLQYKDTNESLPADSVFKEYLKEQGYRVTQGNELKLLKSGREKFITLFKDIDKAKDHINLEYFNFRNDSIGKVLFTHLVHKAKEGVKIRVIFDDFGNMSNNKPLQRSHVKELKNRGLEVIRFDPIKFPYVNHIFQRDHQKIVVIDEEIGYVGGMNVADYYINGLPEIGEWRDMHVRIKGPAVMDLQNAFYYNWKRQGGRPHYEIGFEQPRKDTLPRVKEEGEVAIVQRIPHKAPKSIRNAYVAAIDAAQSNIQIINPYFVPTRTIRKALKRAIKRGVNVEIMYPSKSDIPFTPHAGFYYANKMRKAGANVYLFNNGFHHSKIMMVDHTFCTVGSCNLDSRSLRYDFEINAFIFDKATTHELNDLFEKDKQSSTLYTDEVHAKRPIRKKIAGWFAHLLTPFL